MAKKSNFNISSPILYVAMGILLAVFGGEVLNWVVSAIGIVFIVIGIVNLVKHNILSGIINIVIGVILPTVAWLVLEIVLLVLGIFVVVKGIIELVSVLKLPKKKRNFFKMIFPILTIVAGAVLLFGNLIDWAIVLAGVCLIVDGVLGIIGAKK